MSNRRQSIRHTVAVSLAFSLIASLLSGFAYYPMILPHFPFMPTPDSHDGLRYSHEV